jgi:hypothetical protein
MKAMGLWFIAGLPAIVIATALFTYSQPRLFFSRTVIELSYDPADIASAIHNAGQGSFSVVEHAPGTNRYSIGVYSADAEDAAAHANEMTEAIVKALNRKVAYGINPEVDSNPANLVLPSGKVWERAEPALVPTIPHAGRNMAYSFWIGLISAAIGLVLLAIASGRKRARATGKVSLPASSTDIGGGGIGVLPNSGKTNTLLADE